jgi:hypothetical protein
MGPEKWMSHRESSGSQGRSHLHLVRLPTRQLGSDSASQEEPCRLERAVGAPAKLVFICCVPWFSWQMARFSQEITSKAQAGLAGNRFRRRRVRWRALKADMVVETIDASWKQNLIQQNG